MPSKITFDKESRERAKKQGTALFAYGMETPRGSRLTAWTPALSGEEADCLSVFLINLVSNKKPLKECVKQLEKSLKNITNRKVIKL